MIGTEVIPMQDKTTIQDIFDRFYPDYLKKYNPSFHQQNVAKNILNCKTGAYGANVSECSHCGYKSYHYNSCRNRCCPMCQAVPTAKWIDARKADVVEAPYFHIVFTVPSELNLLIYYNQEVLYDALYKAAAETLKDLSKDRLGITPGIISVLHTWGSNLDYHPHIHSIVLGGGLTDNNTWKDNGKDFFLPVRVISPVFRAKYLEKIKDAYEDNDLVFPGSIQKYKNRFEFKKLINACFEKAWIPYSKKPFKNADAVIEYLARYTHKIAISNSRIISMDDENVTFRYKDYSDNAKMKIMTLTGVEFIRRFLMHVPPKGFVRLRHYGLLSNRGKEKYLTLCRNLLGCKQLIPLLKDRTMPDILKILYKTDICKCKKCGSDYSITYNVRYPLLN